jgi:hypothetical protein
VFIFKAESPSKALNVLATESASKSSPPITASLGLQRRSHLRPLLRSTNHLRSDFRHLRFLLAPPDGLKFDCKNYCKIIAKTLKTIEKTLIFTAKSLQNHCN